MFVFMSKFMSMFMLRSTLRLMSMFMYAFMLTGTPAFMSMPTLQSCVCLCFDVYV